MTSSIRTVLFDLDGTLADTAPDLAYALNQVRSEQGLAPLSFDTIRPHVSHGGIALTRLGFNLEPDHPEFPPLRQRLLDIYRDNLTRETRLFAGMDELLTDIETAGLSWGVVTNKPAFLTEPLLEQLQLNTRAACIVSGDTCTRRKPHPDTLLHACKMVGSDSGECIYIGDAQRDIEAGRAAGMHTMVALFGYLSDTDQPQHWTADYLANTPADIWRYLQTRNAAIDTAVNEE